MFECVVVLIVVVIIRRRGKSAFYIYEDQQNVPTSPKSIWIPIITGIMGTRDHK